MKAFNSYVNSVDIYRSVMFRKPENTSTHSVYRLIIWGGGEATKFHMTTKKTTTKTFKIKSGF